jgi:oxygen-independent coproporphyrinogen-3 oxidase
MLQALVKELQLRNDELRGQTIETIYFGGGTPSLLSITELKLLIDTVYKNYTVIENPEITLEANPDDLSEKQIHKLTNTRINRLSIGIQSFFDDDLTAMNRAHNSKEAKESLSVATRYFDNITIDLIYGIPNMADERWQQNLQTAFDFGVSHISSYALTVEPKTALADFIKKGKYPPVSEALAAQHFKILVDETEKQGFVQYEISNFGKPGYFSKHNTAYWQQKPYLGIGPSAHSYNGTHRRWNVSNNARYIKALQANVLPQEIEKLSVNDRFNEVVMTGLRTVWGVSLVDIERDFGRDCKNDLLKNSEKFIVQKLLKRECDIHQDKDILKITEKGKFLCDGIASSLFKI